MPKMALRAVQVVVALLGCALEVAALSILKPESDLAAQHEKERNLEELPDADLAAHHDMDKSLEDIEFEMQKGLEDVAFQNGITLPDVQVQLEARESLRAEGQLLSPLARVKDDATVCVSLPVFEDADYIEELLTNFLFYTEPTTKIALHFDNNTDIDTKAKKRIKALAPHRIAWGKTRIPIRKIGGSILYAHLLNAKKLEKHWPGECSFFVMQASNMWWVRKGMENSVRAHRYAELVIQGDNSAAVGNSGPFYHELTPKKLHGWGQPEGAFFPMGMVNDFNKYLDAWLERTSQDFNAVLDRDVVTTYVEAFWLPTYALNLANDIPEESVGASFALCYRHMVETVANYEKDSVPLNEVKDLAGGAELIHDAINDRDFPSEQYYAVKRVNRDLGHPVTKYIAQLAH